MTKDLQTTHSPRLRRTQEALWTTAGLEQRRPQSLRRHDGALLESLEASDFIEQMFGKDLTDATWEIKRYSRHKALVIERQHREQQDMEEKAVKKSADESH